MSIKKKVIILVSVCSIVLIGALIGDKLMSKTYLNKISVDNLIAKIENKEDLILLVSKTNCSYCVSYKPKLEKVANKYKINIYYVEIDLLAKEELEKFESYIKVSGTPETVFLKDGEEKTVASRISGNASTEKIIKKLKSNGFID